MKALCEALLLALGFADGPGVGKHALRACHVNLDNYCCSPSNATLQAALLQGAATSPAGVQSSTNLFTSINVMAVPGRRKP